jgi:diacylglycerol kinase family enzyme
MAEKDVPGDKTDSREITITLPAANGVSEVIANLGASEDAAQPPRLIKVERRSLDDPQSALTRDNLETHIVLSIGSGHQLAEKFYEDVLSPILREVYGSDQFDGIQTHITQSATSVLELAQNLFFKKANEGKLLRIILASGDGGIVDLVNGLLAQPASPSYKAPQIVVLPLGTANALYHSVNAGTSNTWGLKALSTVSYEPLPIFTASFSPCARLLVDEARSEEELPKDPRSGHGILHGAVVCSWGMHASLVADSDTTAYRKFGVERFKMAAKEALYPADGSAPHAYKADVSFLNGSEWRKLPESEHMYVLSTMVSNLEQSFCISPASKPLDGSMHLVYFGPTSGDEAMRIMGLAYQGGKHVEDAAVRYESIDGLRVEFKGQEDDSRWRRICVDGKIVAVGSEGWVEIRKETATVMEVALAA